MSKSPELPKKFWILDGKVPKAADLYQWAVWFEHTATNRIVAQTRIGDDTVSTVFLGIDHSMGGPVPLLFETMIFVDGDSAWCERCTTWDQAEEQHVEAVAVLKQWHENAKAAAAKVGR